MIGDVEVGISSSDNKTVKRLPPYTESTIRATGYLNPNANVAITLLKKAFTRALIFSHFNLKCHIEIKTDISDYAIGKVLNQLISDNLAQWHLVTYFLRKMILAKT